jgi:hypothetical protein
MKLCVEIVVHLSYAHCPLSPSPPHKLRSSMVCYSSWVLTPQVQVTFWNWSICPFFPFSSPCSSTPPIRLSTDRFSLNISLFYSFIHALNFLVPKLQVSYIAIGNLDAKSDFGTWASVLLPCGVSRNRWFSQSGHPSVCICSNTRTVFLVYIGSFAVFS